VNVLLVGDTHGNTRWWTDEVIPAALAHGVDLIAQVGDFGYWSSTSRFVRTVADAPVPVLFLDGNHEHHPQLRAAVDERRGRAQLNPTSPVPLGGALVYLPRGARLLWNGVRVAALGGAHSIDRRLRTPSVDWFAEESVTEADLDRLAAAGPADVLLAHDVPAAAAVPLRDRALLPTSWTAELPACDAHRELLDRAVDAVRPSLLVHGHYHVRWSGSLQRPWGRCEVLGLDCDGSGVDAMALLRCRDGRAEVSALRV
jgi:predicted phosphodiesterase